MSNQQLPCDGCGDPTDIDLLDAKLELDDTDPTGIKNGGSDAKLLCKKCYGHGWNPAILTNL